MSVVTIDTKELSVTPFFKHIIVEDVPQSEIQGKPVYKELEVVEVRFAGTNNFAPVFPVDAMWKREGHRVITYAERWGEQYRQFKEGNPQEANGTPLEALKPYGMSDSDISICRAYRIYSVEALYHLEDKGAKNLGMVVNRFKDAARRFMSDRMSGEEAQRRIRELEEQINKLKGKSTDVPEDESELLDAMTDEELRVFIEDRTGAKPDGRFGRDKLIELAKGL